MMIHRASFDEALRLNFMFPTILAGSDTAVLNFCKISVGYPNWWAAVGNDSKLNYKNSLA